MGMDDIYTYRNSVYIPIYTLHDIRHIHNYIKDYIVYTTRFMVIGGGTIDPVFLDTANMGIDDDILKLWLNINSNLILPLLLLKLDTYLDYDNRNTYEVFNDEYVNVIYIIGNFDVYCDCNTTRFLNMLCSYNVNVLYIDDIDGKYKTSYLPYCTDKDIRLRYLNYIKCISPDVVVLYNRTLGDISVYRM
jgi:hypothetical protein